MRRFLMIAGVMALMGAIGILVYKASLVAPQPQTTHPAQPSQAIEETMAVQEVLDQLPNSTDSVTFATKDWKQKGWKVIISGNRPLAMPAVVEGKIFLGGGFGSHEFYALDAVTGKVAWRHQTKDDGPTAAVVSDGYVGFNTESCEIEILALDRKPVWKKWLGDPLMSMPAIADGKLYMAYPDSKGDHQHYLACFNLKTGQELWKKPIAGEIITAPVIADGKVYIASLEGTFGLPSTAMAA